MRDNTMEEKDISFNIRKNTDTPNNYINFICCDRQNLTEDENDKKDGYYGLISMRDGFINIGFCIDKIGDVLSDVMKAVELYGDFDSEYEFSVEDFKFFSDDEICSVCRNEIKNHNFNCLVTFGGSACLCRECLKHLIRLINKEIEEKKDTIIEKEL